MIDYRFEDLTIKAMNGMKDMIVKFIRESFKGSFYVKSLDCLRVLRESCIDSDEIDLFNNFLDELKGKFPKDHFKDYWRMIVDNKVTLIDSTENQKSSISPNIAVKWIEDIAKKDAIAMPTNDIEDLINDID